MTPARHHRERALAALQGAANPQFDQQRANAYELQLMQLAEASENGDYEAMHAAMQPLYGLNAKLLNTALSQALTWANNIGRESAED